MKPLASPQGRPKDEAKRSEILNAAEALFFHQGYTRTTLDEVALSARVSKLTIYSHFENKEALLKHVMYRKCQDTSLKLALPNLGQEELETTLTRVGLHYLKLISTRDMAAMYRLVIAESAQIGGLADLFFQVGPESLQQELAKTLESAHRIKHASALAAHFFALLKGENFLPRLAGTATRTSSFEAARSGLRPTPRTHYTDLRKHVDACVVVVGL